MAFKAQRVSWQFIRMQCSNHKKNVSFQEVGRLQNVMELNLPKKWKDKITSGINNVLNFRTLLIPEGTTGQIIQSMIISIHCF